MAKVEYTGNADFREVTKADFERNQVEDQGDVTWTTQNRVAEVSKAAAEFLSNVPDFKVVEEPTPPVQLNLTSGKSDESSTESATKKTRRDSK